MEKIFEEVVLGRQIDAVARVLKLLPNKSLTSGDIFKILAQAEVDAEFLCGFVDLNQHDNEKRVIIEKAVERGAVSLNESGHLSLTAEGKERGKKELPQPIEENIK
ncbi:MAG TPA: hypothetical protein VI978_03035 [Candidatus Paceibacterota bacterium]